jgi:hypothetical protein
LCDKAPTFGTTAGIGNSVTFGMTAGTAAGIGGNAAVFGTMWICGSVPTAGTISMASISGRVTTGMIGGFGTTGMPEIAKEATRGGREQDGARGWHVVLPSSMSMMSAIVTSVVAEKRDEASQIIASG